MSDDDDETYHLSPEGITLMAGVLSKAEDKGLITHNCFTEANLKDYIQTLADQDEIWEDTIIVERDQKLVLLMLTLMPMAMANKTNAELN